jgi:hypothetical protein
MKIKELEQNKFKPIKFKIVIKNANELLTLWHKLNLTKEMIMNAVKGQKWKGKFNFEWDESKDFLFFIDDKIKNLNLEEKI